jgi:NitT/TauT family transport system permease protein
VSPDTLRSVRNGLMLVAGLLLAWQLLYWFAGEVAMRSPLATVQFTATLVASESFWPHLSETMRAFAAALAIAVALGLAIGFWLGLHRLSGDVMEPMLVAVYSIPKITLYPLVLLAFGLGMPAKIAFGAIHGIIPIALFTINALRNVKPILLKTGRALNLGTTAIMRGILFPAAVPEIFTGIRVGFSLTLIGTLLGEMFAAQRGLGYLLMNAIGLHNVDLIMAVTLILVVFAASVSTVLLWIDRRLYRRV